MPSSYLTRQSLAPTGWDSATWALIDAQLRERAFFMAGVDQAQTLQRFRTLAAQVAGGGKGAGEARALMRDYLISTGYRPEPGKEGSLQDLLSDKRRKLVLDVNVRQARGWMQHEQYKADPNVGGQELFRRFGRKQPRDWSARWIEAAQAVGWEGVARGGAFVALLDSPIWSALSRFGHPYPPFDFNSGMSTRPVSRARCEQLGLTPPAYEPPSSFNEEVTASTAGLDADLEAQLLQAFGGLVEKQGSTLRMADINGSRPYTAEQLARVLATPLPPGIPNLQAKAWAAFTQAPESLLPSGENAHLLPALRMMAARLRPEAPAALRDFLSRIDSTPNAAPRVTNSRSGDARMVTNSAERCGAKNPELCRYHHPKGTTREGETKKRTAQQSATKETDSIKVHTVYHYRREARSILDQQARERQGAIAPGMNKMFHITRESAAELTSGEHAKQSDSYEAHYTAAVNVLRLWRSSESFDPPHDKVRDRYNDYKDSPLEWVHYRKAVMTLNGEDYAVKLTAKEYKGTDRLPIIYQVKAKRMRGLHARGADLGKTSSTAHIPYSFFESQNQAKSRKKK